MAFLVKIVTSAIAFITKHVNSNFSHLRHNVPRVPCHGLLCQNKFSTHNAKHFDELMNFEPVCLCVTLTV